MHRIISYLRNWRPDLPWIFRMSKVLTDFMPNFTALIINMADKNEPNIIYQPAAAVSDHALSMLLTNVMNQHE